jgi:type II secretory pathway pseudopilin PulG
MESLVALTLFALSAAAVGTLLTNEIRLQGTNGTTTTAVSLAERELEDLRSMDYSDIASRSATSVVGGATYYLTTTVVPDSPAPLMKSVTTNVTWTEAVGAQSYLLYAIYTDVTR